MRRRPPFLHRGTARPVSVAEHLLLVDAVRASGAMPLAAEPGVVMLTYKID